MPDQDDLLCRGVLKYFSDYMLKCIALFVDGCRIAEIEVVIDWIIRTFDSFFFEVYSINAGVSPSVDICTIIRISAGSEITPTQIYPAISAPEVVPFDIGFKNCMGIIIISIKYDIIDIDAVAPAEVRTIADKVLHAVFECLVATGQAMDEDDRI